MLPSQAPLVIAFADVCGSTGLFERYGDVAARRLCAQTLDRLRGETERTGGRVVKTIGDEVLCVWPRADAALDAGAAMHRAVAADPALARHAIAVRVGIHAGPALLEGGDVYGDAVNVAARVASAAKARQTLTTGDTLALLPAGAAVPHRFVERTAVRGRQQPVDLLEVLWQGALAPELTMIHGLPLPQRPAQGVLRIEYGGDSYTVSEDQPVVSLGRGEDNDVVIAEQLVSRHHLRASFRKGLFVLSDASTNGTGVVSDDGRVLFLHRDEATLYGSGRITPGRRADDGPGCEVRYRLET